MRLCGRVTKEYIEHLEKEIRKTEYEKAREPLEQKIFKLNKEIFELKEEIGRYRQLVSEISKSLKNDTIELFVKIKPIEVQFGNINDFKIQDSPFEIISIPIKEEFRKSIYKRLFEISQGEE